MMVTVAKLSEKVPDCCQVTRCDRGQCKVSLNGAPINRLVVDMDCEALGLINETRCDYLFVSEEDATTWIAPIELKGGKVGSVTRVANQLRGGADLAAELLLPGIGFRFAPVLAHKKPMHKHDLKKLRKERIRLRGVSRMIETVRCGAPLVRALKP